MEDLTNDSALANVVDAEFIRYIRHLASRVDRAVHCLPKEKTWTKPFPFGNSVGHLVLHLTGNLNHFVGALIGGSDYVRDRPREFADPQQEPAEVILGRFREAVEMVVKTIETQGAADLQTPVSAQAPVETRFGLLLLCTAHLNNHIGQMSYLVQALGHSTEERPSW